MSLLQHICKFSASDVMFRICSFICLRLFCRISSLYAFLRLFNFTHEPRIHWKKCSWKRAHFTTYCRSLGGKSTIPFWVTLQRNLLISLVTQGAPVAVPVPQSGIRGKCTH